MIQNTFFKKIKKIFTKFIKNNKFNDSNFELIRYEVFDYSNDNYPVSNDGTILKKIITFYCKNNIVNDKKFKFISYLSKNNEINDWYYVWIYYPEKPYIRYCDLLIKDCSNNRCLVDSIISYINEVKKDILNTL